MDRALLRLLRTRAHWPPLERAAQAYALCGENGFLWLALAARRRDRRALRVVLTALIVNTAVKQVVRRARPDLGTDWPPLGPTMSTRSYPSAHAATSFAGAGALGGSAPLYAAAGAMALTRPYLGLHYPSDVVAGALLGWAVERLS